MSRSDWKVGDRVQTDKGYVIRVGALTAIESGETEQSRLDYLTKKTVKYMSPFIKSFTVKWDDGKEEVCGAYDVYREDSEMERSFRLVALNAQKVINEKISIAMTALEEAVKVSDETGVPFSAGISPLSQSYFPASFRKKHPDVEIEFVSAVTDSYESGYGDGWAHSAVC